MIRTFVPGGSVCLVGVLPHLLTAPARSVYSYLLLLLLIRCPPLKAGGAQLRLLAQRAKHLERCVATARHAHFYMDLSVH